MLSGSPTRALRHAHSCSLWGPQPRPLTARWHCFPNARAAIINGSKTTTDADFVHLKGLRKLNMWGCDQPTITDAAFVHLQGIHTLEIAGCDQHTITDAAFMYFDGIHTLNMADCNQPIITDGVTLPVALRGSINGSWICKAGLKAEGLVVKKG